MKTTQEILSDSSTYLERHGSESSRADAEWLMCEALDVDKLELYMQFDRLLGDAELARLRPLLRRRAAGEPVQYIIGDVTFHSVELVVGPGVLIPRPETERLVDEALQRYPGEGAILDVCTGSGAILFAMNDGLDDPVPMIGVDTSADALAWALRNRELLAAEHIDFLQGDLFGPVAEQKFVLITANPPYIASGDLEKLPNNVRGFEPHEALLADDDGLAVIRRIAMSAAACLCTGGQLLCEIGATQGEAAQRIFADAGWADVEILTDYARRDRIVAARLG
ncbi:MAG: peptide chain release factor N(5)-glutamine methyltransferase [Lentisphaeria bacterium]